ncbi:hypothetical protein [Ornithinimicrobium flavum]|uniref:hypothetical protein n=1 Tax=Ornithinimicrobium flavum TaxID=1288636 RepID=UPI001EE861A8|nr:hypothetical protein [Ornithinimicrobium flavum]
MEDAFPLEWAGTLRALAAKAPSSGADAWVPGHGDVVDQSFVQTQTAQLAELAERFAEVLEAGPTGVEALIGAARGLGLQEQTLREAAVRALELRGTRS